MSDMTPMDIDAASNPQGEAVARVHAARNSAAEDMPDAPPMAVQPCPLQTGRPRRSNADYNHNYGPQLQAAPRRPPGRRSDVQYPEDMRQLTRAALEGDQGTLRSYESYQRQGMTANHTAALLAQDRALTEPSHEGQAVAFAVDVLGQGLSDAQASRNHILADSSINALLHTAYASGNPSTPAQDAAVRGFLRSVAGDDDAAYQGALASWNAAQAARGTSAARDHLHSAVHTISLARGNLRFGDASTNEAISNAFDPVMVEGGGVSPRSAEIRDGVMGLGSNGLVSHPQAIAATTPAIDPATGTYMTSSSSRERPDQRSAGLVSDDSSLRVGQPQLTRRPSLPSG